MPIMNLWGTPMYSLLVKKQWSKSWRKKKRNVLQQMLNNTDEIICCHDDTLFFTSSGRIPLKCACDQEHTSWFEQRLSAINME